MIYITQQDFVGCIIRTIVRKDKKCYPIYNSFGRRVYVPVKEATIVARKISGIQCITRGGNQCSGSGTGVFVPVGGKVIAQEGDYLEWYHGSDCGITKLEVGKVYMKTNAGNAYCHSQWVEML